MNNKPLYFGIRSKGFYFTINDKKQLMNKNGFIFDNANKLINTVSEYSKCFLKSCNNK